MMVTVVFPVMFLVFFVFLVVAMVIAMVKIIIIFMFHAPVGADGAAAGCA